VRTHSISEELIVSQKNTLYLSSWDSRAYSLYLRRTDCISEGHIVSQFVGLACVLIRSFGCTRVLIHTHTHTHFLHARLRQKANIHEFMRAFSVAWVHVY